MFLPEVCSLSVGQGRECKESHRGKERQDSANAPDGGKQQSENASEAKPPRGSTRPADHPEQQRQTSKRCERSHDENPRHVGRGMHLIGCRSHSRDDKGDREDNAEAAYEARKSACDLRTHPAGQSTAAGRRFSQGRRHDPRPAHAPGARAVSVAAAPIVQTQMVRRSLLAAVLLASTVVGLSGSSAVASRVGTWRIECRLAHRPTVTTAPRPGPVIRLSAPHSAATVRAGLFGLRATAGIEPGESDPSGLSIRVWGRRTGKPVASTLHQFGRAGPSNQFTGGHGFTGLVYAYLPSGAELQYYCRSI